jgi:hypothetical protein
MSLGKRGIQVISVLSWLLCHGITHAQVQAEKEAPAILEIGGAPGWSVTDRGASISPTVAVEMTPIENWLELEMGTTPTFSRNSTQWDTDLLFKKPWTFSKKVEFMFGVGPEWIVTRKFGSTTNSFGSQVALDFMFWPAARHKFGWYLEPAYEWHFGAAHEQSASVSVGLLIAIP